MRNYLFPSCLKYAAMLLGVCLSVAPASAASYWWNSTGSGSGTGGSGTWNTSSALWKTSAVGTGYQAWPNSEGSPSAAVFAGTGGGNVTIAADTEIFANGLDFSNMANPNLWRLQSGNGASRLVLSGATNTITLGTTSGSYLDFNAVFNTKVELRGTTTMVRSGVNTRVGIGTNPTSSSTSGSLTIASGGIANFFTSGARPLMFAVGHQAGTLSAGVTSVTGSADFTGGTMSLYTPNLTVGAVSAINAVSAPVTGTFTSGIGNNFLDSSVASVVGQVYLNHASATYVGTASGILNWQGGAATFSNTGAASPALLLGRFLSGTDTPTNSTNVAAASGTFNISGGTVNIGSTNLSYDALTLAFRSTNLGANSTASGTVNLTGGTLNITVIGQEGLAGDISGGGGTSTFNLDGGTLDMNGNNLGRNLGLITNLYFRSGTLLDVGQINNGDVTRGILNKTTTGTLTLSGTNTYTAGTTLTEGTLQAGSDTAFGSGALNLNAGKLSSNSTTARAIANAVTFGGDVTLGDASNTGVLTFNGAGTLTGNRTITTASNVTYAGVIGGGSNGLTKAGAGTLTFSAANTYTGNTIVSAGTLLVNGSLNTASAVQVGVSGTLAGSGSAGVISGAGLVAPGNSPGILTATQVDGTSGLDFAFEITASTPTYGSPGASLNDVLRLTDGITPFVTALDGDNTVTVDFSSIVGFGIGQTYTGGFYASVDFASSISGANFVFVGADGFTIAVSTVQQNADFGTGTINGYVTQFDVLAIPEPSTTLLVAGALTALVIFRRRRH